MPMHGILLCRVQKPTCNLKSLALHELYYIPQGIADSLLFPEAFLLYEWIQIVGSRKEERSSIRTSFPLINLAMS